VLCYLYKYRQPHVKMSIFVYIELLHRKYIHKKAIISH